MQGQIDVKRNKLVQQTRKKRINTYMAACRSKMLEFRQKESSQQALVLLNSIFPPAIGNLSKIKILLEALVKDEKQEMKDQTATGIDNNKIQGIVSMSSFQKIAFKHAHTEYQIQHKQLCSILSFLSRELCSKVPELNKMFQQLNKLNLKGSNASNLEKISELRQNIKEIKEISFLCTAFLSGFINRIKENCLNFVNQTLLESITSCLVQLSCFKPRRYQNQFDVRQLREINAEMEELRDLINKETSHILLQLTKLILPLKIEVKVMSNITYTFGNIFVSLSYSSEESQPQHLSDQEGQLFYQSSHDIIFEMFKTMLDLSETSITPREPASFKADLQQMWSLIVWFIRNEILIVLGMFKRKSVFINSPMQYDQRWIHISLRVLQTIVQTGGTNLSVMSTKTIIDVISSFKLLNNDFKVKPDFLRVLFPYLASLFEQLAGEESQQDQLRDSILQFYAELLELFKLLKVSPKEEESAIVRVAFGQLTGRISAPVVRLWTTIIRNSNSSQSKKLFQQLCKQFKDLVQIVLKEDSEVICSFLKLCHQIVLAEQEDSGSEMKSQFFNIDLAASILLLCQKIWEEDKDKDIILSLELLKTIANVEHFSCALKEVIINGYMDQLSSLSVKVSQEINTLVYQIYELLEIQ